MTGEIGAEYRYICATCLSTFGPRGVREHVTDGCAAVTRVQRLDIWLLENAEECPECGLDTPDFALPEDMADVAEWHNSGAETIMVEPCRHEVDVEDIINEHGGD